MDTDVFTTIILITHFPLISRPVCEWISVGLRYLDSAFLGVGPCCFSGSRLAIRGFYTTQRRERIYDSWQLLPETPRKLPRRGKNASLTLQATFSGVITLSKAITSSVSLDHSGGTPFLNVNQPCPFGCSRV